jgi:hypothetical protein
MFYDSDDATIYSYDYAQPLAKWWQGKIVMLSLSYASPTVRKHSHNVRWEARRNDHAVITVEAVKSRSTYTTHSLDRWQSYSGTYHYYGFPDESFFESVLRPGNPPLPGIRFTKRYWNVPTGIIDENGRSYMTRELDGYDYGYGTYIRKAKGKYPWTLVFNSGTRVENHKTLRACRKRIASFEQVFNCDYDKVKTWLRTAKSHPHKQQVRELLHDWEEKYWQEYR